MTTPPSRAVQAFGQSIWFDNIQRSQLRSGALARMIADQSLTGLTSNSSIFEKVITGSRDYDAALATARQQQPQARPQELFYDLAISDIREAADLFAAAYTVSDGRDGLVSLEISPELAYDTDATIEEAEALFHRVDRPNLLIKVPATLQALRAIETLIGPDTVNTLPLATFTAFNDHGKVAATLEQAVSIAAHQLAELEALGIDLNSATRQLELDGIAAFADSYHNPLQAIANKTQQLSATGG